MTDTTSASGAFVEHPEAGGASPAAPERKPGNPRLGYIFAALNAIISGVAIYINSNGVKTFKDSTLYTALKNAVVGVCVLVLLLFFSNARSELRRLTGRQLALLGVVALLGGSVSYALDFRGLQLSTPVTASLIDHTQFLYVAIFAAIFLHDRFGPAVWLALGVLFVGLSFGLKVNAVRWDTGAPFLIAAALMFAFDFIVIKHLLHSVSMLTVMLFKMTVGAALLVGYVGATGHLSAVSHLSGTQWRYVLVTGLILLAFTLTSIAGLRHASATAVIAIGAGSPLITTALVVINKHKSISQTTQIGLALVLLAILVIFTFGQREELRGAARREPKREEAVVA